MVVIILKFEQIGLPVEESIQKMLMAWLAVKTLSDIMLTCQCNLHPFTPHFYKVKLGFTGVTLLTEAVLT